jgi:hypothetical protein
MFDEFLRILGIQDTLIIYFNYADQPAVNVLKKALGIRARVIKLEPEANILPPEVNKYPIVIVIGPETNPAIKRLLTMRALPKTQGIFTLGNMIFIVGKSPLDTFELVSQFIKNDHY